MLLVYGILTETSISKLFIAGIVPGLIAVGLYMLTILVVTRIRPAWGPPGERASWGERGRALAKVWPVIALFVIVMGGIYGGIFTPTEAAGIGAFGAFLFALARGALSWNGLVETLVETAVTSAMIFFRDHGRAGAGQTSSTWRACRACWVVSCAGSTFHPSGS